MRAQILALLLLTGPGLLSAQQSDVPEAVRKGSKLIDGSARISRQRDDGASVTTISIQPEMLLFLADGFAAGGRVGLTRQSSDAFTSTGWTLGPAIHLYFRSDSETLLPFVGLAATFGKSRNESGGSDLTSTQRVLDGSLGVTRLLSRQVGITAEIFFTQLHFNAQVSPPGPLLPDNDFSEFGVRFGISAFLLQNAPPR